MPQQVEAAPGAAPAAGGRQGGNGMIGGLIRMAVTYYIMRTFMGGKQGGSGKREEEFWPRLNKSTPMDVEMYFAESPIFPSEYFDVESRLVWAVKSVELAGKGVDLSRELVYRPTPAVQANGTLFLHAFFSKAGVSPNPVSASFERGSTYHKVHSVISYKKEPKKETGVSLLGGDEDGSQPASPLPAVEEEGGEQRRIVSFIKPNLTVAMVDSFQKYPAKAIPPHVRPHLDIDPFSREYAPVVFFNDFWLLRDYLIPMNETVEEVHMHLFLHTLASWKWQLYMQMEQSFSMQSQMGMTQDGESDEFKRVVLEGNPFLLALTFVVSMAHSVLDVFAFKSDIGFWKGKENMTGMSVRSIFINACCQVVIFLYLLDNETSFVVLGSSFVGMLIEFWKVTKAMDVSVGRTRHGLPWLVFKDKSSYSDTTAEHDAVAMQYLSYALYPLIAAYAVYTLVYEKHRSWYSWVLSTLVGAVYTFGFILMCPQLYLNYKLKSVAHLPWRQMSYKFLNTIIDDLFAFVIKMPTLHRIAVFRDDIIFLIFMYQRYIYPVDKKRPNEFGYTEVEPEGASAAGSGAASDGTLLQDGADAAAATVRRRREGGEEPGQAVEAVEVVGEAVEEVKKDK